MKYFTIIIWATLLFSCSRGVVFEEKITIQSKQWHSDSIATFSVSVNDTISSQTIFVKIENNNNYKWQNLFLFTTITFPDGKQIKDTADFLLAFTNGKWAGEKNGNKYLSQYPYKQNIRFPINGTYTFSFEQAMRCGKTKSIEGIESIALTIQKQ